MPRVLVSALVPAMDSILFLARRIGAIFGAIVNAAAAQA